MPSRKRKVCGSSSSMPQLQSKKVAKKDSTVIVKTKTMSALADEVTGNELPTARRLTFMDLPQESRKKIYTYCGLRRACDIYLHDPHEAFEKSDVYHDRVEHPENQKSKSSLTKIPYSHIGRNVTIVRKPCTSPVVDLSDRTNTVLDDPTLRFCYCKEINLALFRISKVVHKEVEQTFYEENQFAVWKCLESGVNTIESLSNRASMSIKKVKIAIGKVTNSDFRSKKGLGTALTRFGDLFDCRLNTTGLVLLFACDMSGLRIQAREMLVQSLSKVRVSQCVVTLEPDRFGNHYYTPARGRLASRTYYGDLAQHLVSNMTQRPVDTVAASHFRYRDLPKELRLMVLRETALVASEDQLFAGQGFCFSKGQIVHKKACCGKCGYGGLRRRDRHGFLDNCVCFGQKSVASSTCTCERSPKTLFLVDKLMQEEAKEVFHSYNRFDFIDKTSRVLRELRKDNTGFIRKIRFMDIRRPRITFYLGDDYELESYVEQLTDLFQHLHANAFLRALELTVYLPRHFPCDHTLDYPFLYHNVQRPGQTMQASHIETLKSCMSDNSYILKQLKAFKVFIACTCLDETMLEQLAMGERYDALKYHKLKKDERDPHLPNLRKRDKNSCCVAAGSNGVCCH